MNYTILGCITKYSVDDIKPYVESIEKSGFKGEKVMLVYDVSNAVIDYLHTKGWVLVKSELNEHIIIQRFRDIYALLNQIDTDVIIWTDVKDVIFQKNPIEWIEKYMKKDILSLSECIKFKDDSWAVVNAGTSFPLEWDWLNEMVSYCAGTIVGKKEAIRDLFIDIYRWSKTSANPQQLSDQAAYNILINLHQFKNVVQFVNQEEGFATQLGTVWVKKNELPITEPTPIYKDGKFYNQKGDEFVIVHQYDRDTQLKKEIYERYN